MRPPNPQRDELHQLLLRWYDRHARDLPWRKKPEPYQTWVSEIMLQQTQVATVIPYFERWMARFPTISALAAASEDDVLQFWQGLGYYRRGRNLLAGAQYVVANGIPSDAAGWQEVPGIGPYTAGAIASIAQNQPAALVDGNVERVYARLTADPTEPPKLTQNAWKWANLNLDHQRPGDWNQALMELGATVCTPKNPQCPTCPLKNRCAAFAIGNPDGYPTPAKRTATVQLQQTLWIAQCGDKVATLRVPRGDWWEGMVSFPRTHSHDLAENPFDPAWPKLAGTFKHSVTHHRITLQVAVVTVDNEIQKYGWLNQKDLTSAAIPAPHRKGLELAKRL